MTMKHEKLLPQKYTTLAGAQKRAEFENGIAPSEYRRGETARLYRFETVSDPWYPNTWRVQRKLV